MVMANSRYRIGFCDGSKLAPMCGDHWRWDVRTLVGNARVCDPQRRSVMFQSTSVNFGFARGDIGFTDKMSYWEVDCTSIKSGGMGLFGLCTERAVQATRSVYGYALGSDVHSYALGTDGYLYHNGERQSYTEPFRDTLPGNIGMLFNRVEGTLTYYKRRRSLGVAFRLLNVTELLYAAVGCSDHDVQMTISVQLRSFRSLFDRCADVVCRHPMTYEDVQALPVPDSVKRDLSIRVLHRII